jgi:hypothetical protein
MGCVRASLFIDHSVGDAKTICPLRCDLIIRLGSRVQKLVHHLGAPLRGAISQLRAHTQRTTVAQQELTAARRATARVVVSINPTNARSIEGVIDDPRL